jgi:hypothetical protein
MAKKQPDLTNIFAKTEPGQTGQAPADNSDLDNGNIKSTGVGLREGEIAALDAIGRQLGDFLQSEPVARNAITRIAIRRMIEDYRAGKITLDELGAYFDRPEKPQPRLRM